MKKFILSTLIGLLLVLSIMPASISAAAASGQSLRDLAEANGIKIGSAVALSPLFNDSTYSDTIAEEFNILTPENMLKFSFVQPEQGVYDFTYPDAIVDFAEANNMEVRGHCLVWHNQLPTWLTEGDWTRDELLYILYDYITTVVKHYKGRIQYWDVVNEAITMDGGYTESIWYQVIGPSYISYAFNWAHQADPDALLFYNDYYAEGMNTKANTIYNGLKYLRSRNIPVHGIGLQMHISSIYQPTTQDIVSNMERLAAIGLDIHITEMDVAINGEVTQAKLDEQADTYCNILEACLGIDAFKSFVMWGFTDRYSYFNNPENHPDSGAAHIFDESYQAKPAYNALVELLTPEVMVYTLNIEVNGSGSTTPTAGNYPYPEGSVVDISATPDEGWLFDGWTGDVANPDSASTTVTIGSNKTISASFIEEGVIPEPEPEPEPTYPWWWYWFYRY